MKTGTKSEMSQVLNGMTIHRVDGAVLYASEGYRVFSSRDGGQTWEENGVVPVPMWRRALDSFPLLRRISRGGVSCLLPRPDGARLCVVPKMILRAEAGSSSFRCVFHFPRGSRPLNLCQLPNGTIYWGEYFLNLRRSYPVRVFCSRDGGRCWQAIFTFPRGSICHLHRIVYDPYDDAILVCTGDRDQEVGILKTTDGFRTLDPLVQGEQRYRTTCVIPLRDSILYGTDNPDGDNYVMALRRQGGQVDEIQKLPGPVLYGCRVGEYAVFATMVEKQHHEVGVWVGNDSVFRQIASMKSRKMNWVWREVVGYSTIILPEGVGTWPDLFLTPVGTQEYADCLIKMNLDGTGSDLKNETENGFN